MPNLAASRHVGFVGVQPAADLVQSNGHGNLLQQSMVNALASMLVVSQGRNPEIPWMLAVRRSVVSHLQQGLPAHRPDAIGPGRPGRLRAPGSTAKRCWRNDDPGLPGGWATPVQRVRGSGPDEIGDQFIVFHVIEVAQQLLLFRRDRPLAAIAHVKSDRSVRRVGRFCKRSIEATSTRKPASP